MWDVLAAIWLWTVVAAFLGIAALVGGVLLWHGVSMFVKDFSKDPAGRWALILTLGILGFLALGGFLIHMAGSPWSFALPSNVYSSKDMSFVRPEPALSLPKGYPPLPGPQGPEVDTLWAPGGVGAVGVATGGDPLPWSGPLISRSCVRHAFALIPLAVVPRVPFLLHYPWVPPAPTPRLRQRAS